MNKSNLYKENCYDNVTKSTIQCKQIKSDIYKYSLSSLSSKNYIVRLHNISSNL